MFEIHSILPRDEFDPSLFNSCTFPTSDCHLCQVPRNSIVHCVVQDGMNGARYCSVKAMPVRLVITIQDERDHPNNVAKEA